MFVAAVISHGLWCQLVNQLQTIGRTRLLWLQISTRIILQHRIRIILQHNRDSTDKDHFSTQITSFNLGSRGQRFGVGGDRGEYG